MKKEAARKKHLRLFTRRAACRRIDTRANGNL
jgi:hypothetical protein